MKWVVYKNEINCFQNAAKVCVNVRKLYEDVILAHHT